MSSVEVSALNFEICETNCASTKGCTAWAIAYEENRCYQSTNAIAEGDAYEIPIDGEPFLSDVCAVMGKIPFL